MHSSYTLENWPRSIKKETLMSVGPQDSKSVRKTRRAASVSVVVNVDQRPDLYFP